MTVSSSDSGSGPSVVINAVTWPETSEYVRGLHGRFDGFPQCKTRALFLRDLVRCYPELAAHPNLPAEAKQLLKVSDDAEWAPTVAVVMFFAMVRDRVFPGDDEFRQWNFERQLRIYQTPFMRALVSLVSPSLLVKSAGHRWKSVQRGTQLRVTGSKGQVEIRFEFPSRLCSRPFLVALVASFSAALSAARARDPQVELVEIGEDLARYRAHWR